MLNQAGNDYKYEYKLYNETGQHKKALALARQILTKEIKVPSQAIEEIRIEMEKIDLK
ncbi:MAG: hypothetical protein FD181_3423 [Prolixibacteraceae bacterium]|nr:MAG: hypothetical protein FD181_3423 [Prolixibacteraceae bacterium]